MKNATVIVACMLLVFSSLPQASVADSEPAECCFVYRAARLPKAGVKAFQRTHLHCATDGVVFHMKSGIKICTDPAQQWVQDLITHVENNRV